MSFDKLGGPPSHERSRMSLTAAPSPLASQLTNAEKAVAKHISISEANLKKSSRFNASLKRGSSQELQTHETSYTPSRAQKRPAPAQLQDEIYTHITQLDFKKLYGDLEMTDILTKGQTEIFPRQRKLKVDTYM
jgi:hypothetical protein